MKTFNGVDIVVGMNVIALITPVSKRHEFENATVVAITEKQVQIKTTRVKHWWSKEKEIVDHYVKRYPEQLIG